MRSIALLTAGTVLVLLLALNVALTAVDRGTPAEAKAMLLKAVAHYKAVGRKQAFTDFTAKKPPFRDRDLYVVCFDQQHMVVSNGGFAEGVGTSGDAVVGLDGRGVATSAWEVTSSTGEGSVQSRWVNPLTHNVELKTTFFARVGDDLCGVGAYAPK